MKKIRCITILFLVFALFLIGCNNSETEAKKTAENFINDFYNINHTDMSIEDISKCPNDESTQKLKKYITDEHFKYVSTKTTIFAIRLEYPIQQKFDVKLDTLNLTENSKDKDSIVYDYNCDVTVTYSDKKQSNIELKGTIPLVKTDEGWKINDINNVDLSFIENFDILNINKKEEINKPKDNEDIFLMTADGYGAQNEWQFSKDYSVLNYSGDEGIYVFKNNKLIYTIKNDNEKDNSYYFAAISPSGNKIIRQKVDNKKQKWKLDLFNAEDGVKEETYLSQQNDRYYLKKWTKRGMFFEKYDKWGEEMDTHLIKKLFILNEQKKFEEVMDYTNTSWKVRDIIDNLVLVEDYNTKQFYIFNIDTKEIKDTNFSSKPFGIDLAEVKFYNSPNILIYELRQEGSGKIFLFKNKEKIFITKNYFVGITKDGVVYAKYIDDGHKRDIYFKLLN
ncbi:hypothetical protein CLTEP_25660 [Clostridium tepidiprofundi DSM 19306]|uniref:Lipoprotein n=1 Tax=Clostridium tepidiprofundi DSM 19306 TaxID=1121338 RepID=A0A151ASI4_9CLOT|nr:hypothetical protein [Clostridium tepidiprofundi]KYH30575.1 hypothetical protein CLTEP_25660 [Clostridium tepidiprofundi DSM 19306]